MSLMNEMAYVNLEQSQCKRSSLQYPSMATEDTCMKKKEKKKESRMVQIIVGPAIVE